METYTIIYQEDKPKYAFFIGQTTKGGRFLAKREQDPDRLEEMVTREVIGEMVTVRHDKKTRLNTIRLRGWI